MRNQQECCIDWLKLPREITVMILQKAGVLQMLMSAEFVCTQWRDICTADPDPSTWSIIRVVDYWKFYRSPQYIENIIKWAVDQSYGSLFDLDLDNFKSAQLLHYVLDRCAQIKRLRISHFLECQLLSLAAKLPFLEDLELVECNNCYYSLSTPRMETLGSNFPRLSSLKIHVDDDRDAESIARSMPQLRHICFFGENLLTDVGVEALLDGCPHLESLDIQQCFLFEMTGAKQKMKKKPLTPTRWRDILNDPCTWSTIRVVRRMFIGMFYNIRQDLVEDLVRRAVDKSCGGLVDLDLDDFMSDDILCYVVERCTQIRRLRGYMSNDFSEETLRPAASRLPLLEDLELLGKRYYSFNYRRLSAETIETLGRCCPRLTSLTIPIRDDETAKTLAKSMPQLRHLKPSNAYALTDVGVEALLKGCSHLESLNLLECKRVRLYGILGIKCAQKIKHLYCSSFFGPKEYRKEDDFDYNQIFEEDVYDVNYMIDSREEYWSRRQKARGRETRIRQLRGEKVNKNKLNDTKRGQKARRRSEKARRRRKEIMADFKREDKKEFVY